MLGTTVANAGGNYPRGLDLCPSVQCLTFVVGTEGKQLISESPVDLPARFWCSRWASDGLEGFVGVLWLTCQCIPIASWIRRPVPMRSGIPDMARISRRTRAPQLSSHSQSGARRSSKSLRMSENLLASPFRLLSLTAPSSGRWCSQNFLKTNIMNVRISRNGQASQPLRSPDGTVTS